MITLVDFNNEAILSTDKYNYNNLLCVEKRQGVIDAFGRYERIKLQGTNAPDNVVRATIKELYRQIRSNFKKIDPDNEQKVRGLIFTHKMKEMEEAFEIIDEWLFESGATQFVRIKNYDSSNPLEEDEAFGL